MQRRPWKSNQGERGVFIGEQQCSHVTPKESAVGLDIVIICAEAEDRPGRRSVRHAEALLGSQNAHERCNPCLQW